MTKKTVYPHTVSQTSDSGNSYREFNNLGNIKNDKDTYAKTGQIASKSGTHKRPSAITCRNFKANIPAGSKINSVTVEYAADYEGNISIGKSTIDILNISGSNKNGKALTTTMTKSTATWSGNQNVAKINSSDFGVKISFPANTKADVGYVKIKYVRIIIDYTVPNYSVTSSKISGQYTNDEFKVKINASNVNKTTGDSNVTIKLPSGVSYLGKDSGDGSVTAGGSKITWKPGLSDKTLNRNIVIKLKITTNGNHKISISEAASSHSTSLNINTVARPVYTTVTVPATNDDETTTESTEINTESIQELKVTRGELFSILIPRTELNGQSGVGLASDTNGIFYATIPVRDCDDEDFEDLKEEINHESGDKFRDYGWIQPIYFDIYGLEGVVTQFFKIDKIGRYTLYVFPDNAYFAEELIQYNITVVPAESELTTPVYTLMKLSAEELNRLGNTHVYTVQSDLQLTTEEEYVPDWGKNFRIGIFNNIIPNEKVLYEQEYSITDNTLILDFPEYPISDYNYKLACNSLITLKNYNGNEDFDLAHEELFTSSNITLPFIFELNSERELTVKIIDKTTNEIVRFEKHYVTPNVENLPDLVETVTDSNDYMNLTQEEIFKHAEYWSNTLTNVNTSESITVDFPYNKDYPVYIIITGDYLEGNPAENHISFTEPCVIESRVYAGRESNGNFPVPILNTIIDADLSETNLAVFEKGNDIVFYDFPLGNDFSVSDTFSITGIELIADVEYSDQLSLTAKLINSDGVSHGRSVIINDNENSILIGGKYELWGFNMSEIVNLEDWRIEFSFNNILGGVNDNAEIKFKNIRLVIYSNKVKSNYQKVYVEGQNVRHLGMFITKVTVPEGLLMDTKYTNIDGSDTNDAYRMNVKSKDIEIEFSVRGCDLQETTDMLRQLAKLFTNERDDLNRPIKKRLEISNYPDVYFEFLMNKPFDSDPTVAGYKSKATLEIPDGTAFAKEDAVTNVFGVNNGIAKVNPIITIAPTGDVVEITESVSGQSFKITHSDWNTNNTVEINCKTRKITILDYANPETGIVESKDITVSAADINNDWFVINREYSFEGDNCIIKTVSFTERY